jgi:hypothetical protein
MAEFGDIKGETESIIMAAQDQTISANYFKKDILKHEIEIKCQMYKQYEDNVDHLTSGYPTLAMNECVMS